MVNTADPLAQPIESLPIDAQLQLLRHLKHETIGHADRKHQVIASGVLPQLIQILRKRGAEYTDVRIQTAIVLASLCQAPGLVPEFVEDQETVLKSGNLGVATLETLDRALLDALGDEEAGAALNVPCLRALDHLAAAGLRTWRIFHDPYLAVVQRLLDQHTPPIKPSTMQQTMLIASLMSCFEDLHINCDSEPREAMLEALVAWIFLLTPDGAQAIEPGTLTCKLIEQALRAIASWIADRRDLSMKLAQASRSGVPAKSEVRPMLVLLLDFAKSKSDLLRVYGISCLAYILQASALPRKEYEGLHLIAVPILSRLLEAPGLSDKAPFVLAQLINDSPDLQESAVDAGAMTTLTKMLRSGTQDAKSLEGTLLALAALTLSNDDFRRQALDAQIVGALTQAMKHSAAKVRAAACQCTRSISRSMAILRTSLIDVPLASAVLALIDDVDHQVRICALAALCNLVLEFSSMRTFFLDVGILERLAPICADESVELQQNAIWALKHIVYAADCTTKLATLKALTPGLLKELCSKYDDPVTEQAMELLRNLICGKPDVIGKMLEVLTPEILLDDILAGIGHSTPPQAVSALYTLVHLAAGNEQHKALIMDRPAILAKVLQHMSDDSEQCRVPAVWIIINLTWTEDQEHAQARRDRVALLTEMGFKAALHELEDDPSQDIRERVKTALLQMQS